jgi:type IV secretory pathway VirB3-like protein
VVSFVIMDLLLFFGVITLTVIQASQVWTKLMLTFFFNFWVVKYAIVPTEERFISYHLQWTHNASIRRHHRMDLVTRTYSSTKNLMASVLFLLISMPKYVFRIPLVPSANRTSKF